MKLGGFVVSLVVTFAAGCVDSSSVTCADGQICPSGTTCAQLTAPAQEICATPEQLASCSGAADGTMCSTTAAPTSACHDGVCLPIVCGNGRLDPGEVCDDGNTSSGDGCSSNCASSETCGNGIVDPLKLSPTGPVLGEECDDGNLASGDGCSSTCRFESPRWDQLDTSGPPGMSHAATAYDPIRGRVVMFGGAVGLPGVATAFAATYEWNGVGWLHVPTDLAPFPRWDARMIYHPGLHRTLMFGGQSANGPGLASTPFSDLWSWDGDRWTLLAGSAPPGFTAFGMVYDAARGVVIVVGANQNIDTTVETWEWDTTTWHKISTSNAPVARRSFVMAYDPIRAVTVLAGGETFASAPVNDTWEYDGTQWHQIVITTPELDDAGAAFDPATAKVIAYGGKGATSTWSYTGAAWTNTGVVTPGALTGIQLATDFASDKVVMYGGDTGGGASTRTWLWNGTSWSFVNAPGLQQGPVYMGAVYDSKRGLDWIFGGLVGGSSGSSEVWSFDGVAWTRHNIVGGPAARAGASAAYDAAHDRTVYFGGSTGPSLAPNDTWLWDGQSWTQATPTMSPLARQYASMAYDAKRGRVVLFGGLNASGSVDDLWEWDGSEWQPIAAASVPTARAAAGAMYDPDLGVVVGVGIGGVGAGGVISVGDVSSWNGTAWAQDDATTPLQVRGLYSLAFQPVRRRGLLFGGFSFTTTPYNDTWEWDGTAWSWVNVALPPSRAGQATYLGRNGSDVLVFGGFPGLNPAAPYYDTWRFRYDSGESRELCEAAVDNDGDGLAGCADPDCWSTCSPQCPPGAPCDAAAPKCGDGICNSQLENCRNCPADCTCAPACGDTFCEGSESHATCPGDCH